MARLPSHTIEDAPAAARSLLTEMIQLGLAVFTSYFLNYAATRLDIPAGPANTGEEG